MRVLHVHSGNIYGGIETMLLTQVCQRNSVPAMESSFALCFAGRLSEALTAAGATVHQLGQVRIRQPLSVWRARRNLRDLLRRQSYDVVVTHSPWSQALFGPVARAAAVPLAFYLHGAAHGRHWLERWAGRTLPDLALCNSRFTATTLPRLYPRARAEIVYYPVAPPALYSGADREAARAELRTPKEATVIIQASRMEVGKGHALHLEALSLLCDLPDWVCWQVGGAQGAGERRYMEGLKEMAARLGIAERVRFLGQRSDVARLLAASDIFCQPNTGPDSFGISFIEALHAQLPVITPPIGGAREIVENSCGVLVLHGDAPSLAAALRGLIEDRALRAKLGAAGPARARQLCDPAAQMNLLHDTLKRIIQARNS